MDYACHENPRTANNFKLTLPRIPPPPPTELKPNPQPPMLIPLKRITRYALTAPHPAPHRYKPQDHQRRQRHTVTAQPHRPPPLRPAEHPPATPVTTQPYNRIPMTQQNAPRNHPGPMGNTRTNDAQPRPPRQRAKQGGKPYQQLAGQVGRQQQARALPPALEALTWAGHGPG